LDKAIPAAMERASVPDAIVGIWQDGRQSYVRAFGVRDTASRQPMTTDLYMRIGSNSKAFTVTAILMLADQSKLRLDDPIDRYVKDVPSGNQITLRQLAAMRSGLYDTPTKLIRSYRSSPPGNGRRESCWRSLTTRTTSPPGGDNSYAQYAASIVVWCSRFDAHFCLNSNGDRAHALIWIAG
jgi:CubicO group peptidase (beta-lactamase class C family)